MAELLKQPFCLPDMEKTSQKDKMKYQNCGKETKSEEIISASKIMSKSELRCERNKRKNSFFKETVGQTNHIEKEHTPKVSRKYKLVDSQSISCLSSSSAINT